MKQSHFLKKIKLFWKQKKILFLTVLVLVIFIPFYLVFADQNSGYPALNGGALTVIFHNKADGTKDPVGTCMYNPSAYSYFVPTKTLTEWLSFVANLPYNTILLTCCGDGVCNEGESPASCPQDCAYLCDLQPLGIYTSAIYSADLNCGATPGCAFNYTSAQNPNPLPQIASSRDGGGCGVLKKDRLSQCASLIKSSFSICDGDPCINGIVHTDYATPIFCVGHYEQSTRRCIYASQISKPLPYWGGTVWIDNYPSYKDGSYGFNTNPSFNSGATGSWGTCYTASAPCGDGLCSAGESCNSCSADCGVCPVVCGDYNCVYGAEDCSSCSTDCGACSCSDYTDEYSCSYASGCSWDYYNYLCIGSCSSYSDYNSCTSAGCNWSGYGCS